MKPSVFREYDIRGIVGKDFTDEDYFNLGRGFGTYLQLKGGKRASLGRDVRLSSPHIRDKVVEGMLSTGITIVDIGVVPTPISYFSLFFLNVDGGLMITASHNPSEYNGFKVEIGRTTIYGEEIQNFRRLIEKGEFKKGIGKLEYVNLTEPYMEALKERISIPHPLHVAIDAGNGTAGMVAPKLLADLGCKFVELFCEPDGRFPNHHPDPTVDKYITTLIQTVKDQKLDIGIGYDGDSDRIGAVDDKGRVIRGDQLVMLFAQDVLTRKPGADIIFDVKCSQGLVEVIKKSGGNPIMWKTGHSLLKNKMIELKSPFAGEMSGHLFFGDNYFGYDDAIFASLRLIELVSKSHKPLSTLMDALPHYESTPEIRVEVPDEKKFDIVAGLKSFFAGKYDVIDIDGVRVVFPDGWGLVRASNTQPALVLRFEAKTKSRLDEIQNLFMGKLKETEGVKV
ncbi:MAG: phosphomannomutase/phosphoglucomutase [Patescibacteria group bacterium]|nr:phosphomannomutase/phosphoglucomutase [Patescibacteria group bacterium]